VLLVPLLRRREIGAALSRVRLAAAVGGMLAHADLDGNRRTGPVD
jgi:hypothetical protein